MTLLASLIAALPGAVTRPTPAPRNDFAAPDPSRRRYHRPKPEHMRHAIAARRATVEAELARIDQAALDAELAFEGKVPPSITAEAGRGYGFVDWPGDTFAVTPTPVTTATWTPLTPAWPTPWTPFPDYPCNCIYQPPVNPPIEQPNQVPLEAGTATLLLCAIALLYGRRLWRAAGRFGDWFTAERGTGPDQNGWV